MTRKFEEIEIPKRIVVFEDKKTNAKTIALPFIFPQDNSSGAILITRLKKEEWKPCEYIKKIIIEYYEN